MADAETMLISPGRYWIAAVGERDIKRFRDWTVKNREYVRIVSVEYDKGETSFWLPNRPATEFSIFTVAEKAGTGGIEWNGPGVPTWAPSEVQSKADTAQRPDPEKDPLDKVIDLNLNGPLGVVLVLGALYLWSKKS
jgi:hypothetical protein